ncbi:MAG TPA: SEC-C metal-binding domain-containing protein, partial [Candidatus Saccharimonadia bacterium]|nr:SEC-C metal-binding domain-containing protein [Candidatus Saccharimonadia bacterium]
ETIYAERDKVLHNEDLTDSVRDFLDEEIDVLVDEHLAAEVPDDWNIDGLSNRLAGMGFDAAAVSVDALWDLGSRDAIVEAVRQEADVQLERQAAEYGEETWSMVERIVLLRTIDSLWVEHLTEIDDMRRGIGLRGYSGTDPLNEFKREAFALYDELRGFIRGQVASTIFRVQVQRPAAPTPTPLPGPGQPANPDAAQAAAVLDGAQPEAPTNDSSAAEVTATAAAPAAVATAAGTIGTATAAAAAPMLPGLGGGTPRMMREQLGDDVRQPAGGTTAPGGQKLGRNDPCYCGSGLKYKKCHGR